MVPNADMFWYKNTIMIKHEIILLFETNQAYQAGKVESKGKMVGW